MAEQYKKVFGWTDFEPLYSDMVDKFDNAIFAELGSFKGRSAVYMAETIKTRKKNIKLVCVDLWPTPTECDTLRGFGAGQGKEGEIIKAAGVSLMDEFVENTKDYRDIIFPIRDFTTYTADIFPDNHFHFIFVDAGHSYDQVKADLEAWYPKLAPGGYMGGHDFYDHVQKAVTEFFGKEVERTCQSSWIMTKPKSP